MTPQALQELQRATVTTVETACEALGIGRTLGYQLARERGELAEGVRVIRVGRMLKVPTRPLLAVLGYGEEYAHECACARAENK
jgi:hypothetical protein